MPLTLVGVYYNHSNKNSGFYGRVCRIAETYNIIVRDDTEDVMCIEACCIFPGKGYKK